MTSSQANLSSSRSEPLTAQAKYMWKSSTGCPGSCITDWNIHWFMPHNFIGSFRNSSGLRKFVPSFLTDDQKLQGFSIWENFLQMSLLVMQHGFTVMMLNPNSSPTGRFLLFLIPRKHDRYACGWKQCFPPLPVNHLGVAYYEFAPEVQTVNQDFYLAVLWLSVSWTQNYP
jgi:hypothetical protein